MRLAFLLMMMASAAVLAAEYFGPAKFRVGPWPAEGTGQPGNASGAFSFAPDLAGHVLVRKSFADYPAADGKPAFRHDDLMIVYRDETSHGLQAIYFESEGQVIRYTLSPAGPGVMFRHNTQSSS